jgi:hypothetical protein
VLKSFGLDANHEFLQSALSAGNFVLLLDGFDEVEHARRARLAQEIKEISQEFPGNWIVLSSRPDKALEGWESFVELAVQLLSLETAVELVRKAPFDETVILDIRKSCLLFTNLGKADSSVSDTRAWMFRILEEYLPPSHL